MLRPLALTLAALSTLAAGSVVASAQPVRASDPDRAAGVLDDAEDQTGAYAFVGAEQLSRATFEPGDARPFAETNPEASITADAQHADDARRQPCVDFERCAVEADQSFVAAKPQVAIAILGDREDAARRKSVAA